MKINLGCGTNYLEGYVNVDPQEGKKVDARRDAMQFLRALDDNRVDEILCEHLLEHIPPVDGFLLIQECFRVLRIKGELIIECPDLDKVGRVYGTGTLHFEHYRKAIFGEKKGVSVGEGHVWGYTEDEMSHILQNVGFAECDACTDPAYFRWKQELSFRIRGRK